MIVPMKHATILCMARDRDKTLDALAKLGLVHVEETVADSPDVAAAAAAVDAAECARDAIAEARANKDDLGLEVFLPALELLVNRLDLGKGIERNLVRLLSVNLVCNCNLNGIKRIQHICLHHNQVGCAVYHNGVLECGEIQPSGPPRPSGGGSELVAFLAEFLSNGIVEFSRERSASNSGAVGLENSKDLAHL